MTEMQDAVLTGLTSREAAQRLAAEGPNELPAARKRNLVQQAWDVVREPMLLLLLGAGTINFALSELLDGIILMSFVVVVIAISVYQEHKTESALAALRDLSTPRALVVRDGRHDRQPASRAPGAAEPGVHEAPAAVSTCAGRSGRGRQKN
jgi:P-type Ca2+ transporter type 2C